MRQARELLRAKRAGEVWTPEEIGFLVKGMADGALGDEQLGAFAMAVALRGMSEGERVERGQPAGIIRRVHQDDNVTEVLG